MTPSHDKDDDDHDEIKTEARTERIGVADRQYSYTDTDRQTDRQTDK